MEDKKLEVMVVEQMVEEMDTLEEKVINVIEGDLSNGAKHVPLMEACWEFYQKIDPDYIDDLYADGNELTVELVGALAGLARAFAIGLGHEKD